MEVTLKRKTPRFLRNEQLRGGDTKGISGNAGNELSLNKSWRLASSSILENIHICKLQGKDKGFKFTGVQM